MAGLGWIGIVRLGLVQAALGAVVVLATTTLNRVMVVELSLPALVPGLLVGLHYAVQLSRPSFGHASDGHRRRTPWILGGMAILAAGGMLAALATAWSAASPVPGLLLAVAAFVLIGAGVGAAGTTLLALLARQVHPRRRAAAATVTWVTMICGFVVTASVAGAMLDPFSLTRLVVVSGAVSVTAFVLALVALWGVEQPADIHAPPPPLPFRAALAQVWAEPVSRNFTLFVFIAMLAYSAQDLILEPFAGLVFGYTPGASTRLGGLQQAGTLAGMVSVALIVTGLRWGTLRGWTIAGCALSTVALVALATAGDVGPGFPLQPAVLLLGFANGMFAAAAIGAMMELVGTGQAAREGTRMGLWGAAQAVAFGCGGFLGAAAVDLLRPVMATPGHAFSIVFAAEALLFVVAAAIAMRATATPAARLHGLAATG